MIAILVMPASVLAITDRDVSSGTDETVSALGCDAYIQIDDPCCNGYCVYVDGAYKLTEGGSGNPDGFCAFYVCAGTHTIKITKNGRAASITKCFQSGSTYSWVSMPYCWCDYHHEPTPDHCQVYIEVQDPCCKGYCVYVDGTYILTEGASGNPDGYCAFYVSAGTHKFELRKGGYTTSKSWYCHCGTDYSWVSMPCGWCGNGNCQVYVQVDDNTCVGYDVYVDGAYILTEGASGTPDGYCAFYVSAGTHKFELRKGGYSTSKSWYCHCGTVYAWVSMPDYWCGDAYEHPPTVISAPQLQIGDIIKTPVYLHVRNILDWNNPLDPGTLIFTMHPPDERIDPPYGVGKIIDGPKTDDQYGYNWWKIEWDNDEIGWSAEGPLDNPAEKWLVKSNKPFNKIQDLENPFNYQADYKLNENELLAEEKKEEVLQNVMKYANTYKISAALIMAIIRQESDFNSGAIGDGGLAIGYMQLHWDAAYDAGYRSSRDTFEDYSEESKNLAREDWPTDGLDPETNIKYGCGYLKVVYNKHGNSPIYDYNPLKNTISAYNLGITQGSNLSNKMCYVLGGRCNGEYTGVIEGKSVGGEHRGYMFFLAVREPILPGFVPSSPPNYFVSNQDKIEEAISWANNEIGNDEWTNLCLKFVSLAYGLGANVNAKTTGWDWPNDAINKLGTKFYSIDNCGNPPRGALIFFSGQGKHPKTKIDYKKYGHIGIYLGDGVLIHAYGTVKIQNIIGAKGIEGEKYIDSYIGWAYPPEAWLDYPLPPTLVSPGCSESPPAPTITTLTPTFEWNSVSIADYYGLYIRDLDMDAIVFNSRDDYGPIYGTSFPLPSGILDYGTHYRWNMNSYNSAGWGEFYSDRCWFTTYDK